MGFKDTKKNIYRATSIIFIIQLFGALGAGFLFVVGNILGVEILKPGMPGSEVLWHIFFWATDYFNIALVLLLSYYIAGLPAIAPALTLSIFFAHFAGQYGGFDFKAPLYNQFFAAPSQGGGGINIGYMGYLIMALMLGYLIKSLYILWSRIKDALSPNLDKLLLKIKAKIKPLQKLEIKGIEILEGIDLIVLVLILPIVSAVLTYFAVYFLIALPFNSLGEFLVPKIIKAYGVNNALGGLFSGALVGFDIIGPLSMAAFRAATNLALSGNAIPMTAFALSFACLGWLPLIAYIFNKVLKKGGNMDTDDMNIAASGPINAFFDNMKLTVNFSMTFAMRDPIPVILAYVSSASITGMLASMLALENKNYITKEFIQKFATGEIYMSFTQPLRSVFATSRGILLPICAAIGVLIGAFLMIYIKDIKNKRDIKNNKEFKPNGDIVLEMRKLSNDLNFNHKQK